MAWTRQQPTPPDPNGLDWSETLSEWYPVIWFPQTFSDYSWGVVDNETIGNIVPEKMWGHINLEWGEIVNDGFYGTPHTDPMPQNNLWGSAFYYDCIPFTTWNYYSDVSVNWITQS